VRFFSHEWAASDDEAADAHVAEAYREMLRTYPHGARIQVNAFVNAFDLRGAMLNNLVVDRAAGTVRLDVFAGDRLTGYSLLTLTYARAIVLPEARKSFEEALAREGTQIRYDEFDVLPAAGGERRCVHRFSFWPRERGEASVEFSTLSWTVELAMERRRVSERPE
jgi:hypothetical protein